MALQFVTNQIKNSAITNDKLAGSIADSKLNQITTAAKVAGSAVQLKSGGPLSNDTGLTISATSVTNSMLAGSIANSKLVSSSVTVAGNAIALGGSVTAATLAGSLSLSAIGVPTGAVAMNSNKITGLATPTADGDAATKAYVDASSQGLDVKDSVKAASTANLTLSGTQTVDGIAMLADDRILVKDQTDKKENGIYLVKAGAWSRSSDFAVGDDEAGAFCFVEQGTVNADSGWVCTANKGAAVVGTNDLPFSQFSGAGQITAGNGLAKSGNTLSVNVDNSSIEINADALQVKALGITDSMLAGSISDAKLSTIATANKVSGSAVQLSTNSAIEDGTGLRLKAATAGDGIAMSAAQVLSIDVSDGVKIQGGKLEASLDGTTLSVSASGIKVADLGVANAQISNSAAIAFSKLAALNSAKILVGNAGNQAASVSLTGDVAITNTGATSVGSVQANAIVTNSITNLNVTTDKLANNAVLIGKMGMRPKSENFSGDGSATTFTLDQRIDNGSVDWKDIVKVFRNGQRCKQVGASPADESEYTVGDNTSKATITFGAAPASLESIIVDYLY